MCFSKVAEKCKDNNWKYVDAGVSFQQSHVQTIFPGFSELFDSIIDYEDSSDEPPHCVIKSFPSQIGKHFISDCGNFKNVANV